MKIRITGITNKGRFALRVLELVGTGWLGSVAYSIIRRIPSRWFE